MGPIVCSTLSVAIFVSLTVTASNWQAQDDQHPTTLEIARLPTFCWAQFSVPNAIGPQFTMPPASECGWGMNHYCFGLIDLIRAKTTTNKRDRVKWIAFANLNVGYTEANLRDFPRCSLREHIAASRAEVDNLMLIYGVKQPRKQ